MFSYYHYWKITELLYKHYVDINVQVAEQYVFFFFGFLEGLILNYYMLQNIIPSLVHVLFTQFLKVN